MAITQDVERLAELVRAGDRRAVARAISIVEDRRDGADRLLALLHRPAREASVVGITGAPGAGKSTLTSELIAHLRDSELSVAVVAVDPSSPFSGGAILGDRIRMQHHVSDLGVYVRSMSTRGHLGGLADATSWVIAVLSAADFDVVLVETVGVGQSETEIVGSADSTVVVVTPGWGDGIQAAKAGLLEIADVFVINKADLGGVDEIERELRLMLELGAPADWEVPIVRTVATDGAGIDRLWRAVSDHAEFLASADRGIAQRRRQVEELIRRAARSELIDRIERRPVPSELVDRVIDGRIDPWSAARSLIS